MNAQEARELTNSKKKGMAFIREAITTMAEAGNNYATICMDKIKDSEGYKKELETEGYKVDLSHNHFNITW